MSQEASAVQVFPESVARLRAALGKDRRGALIWPALSRLDWVAALPNAAAPGFVYLAGACGGTPVGGGGADLAEAAVRLAGEASETLAQAGALPETETLAPDPEILAVWGAGPQTAALCLTRGRWVGAPLAAILPAHSAAPGAPPRSLGLAAGADVAGARLSAVLELVERDAAARWWLGETRGRAVCSVGVAAVTEELAGMRRAATGASRAPAPRIRPTGFLTLPSVTGLPVVCAFSRDAEGRGLALGLKAALDPQAAARGAMIELLQMEIALEIARLRGSDPGPLARAALDPDGLAAFAGLPPNDWTPPPVAGLDDLVGHLARAGLAVTVVDLPGLPGGMAVAKAFVPGLRPLPGPLPPAQAGAPGALAPLM
jgi:hypothetical protein